MERGVQIQEQLHKLVSAFHERARKVKEQVVIQPPSPTLSADEDEKPGRKLSIPLHQMPIHPSTPPVAPETPTARHHLRLGSISVHVGT